MIDHARENAINLMDKILTSENIELVITFGIYAVFFIGVAVLVWDIVTNGANKLKKVIIERQTRVSLKSKESVIDKHIRYILDANQISNRLTVVKFKLLSVSIFILLIFAIGQVLNLGTSILSAAMLAIMPYLLLRVRLEKIRSVASHEAEALVSELLIKYRVKNYNIEEAIEEVIKTNRIKKTKPILSKLLFKLRHTRNENQIKEAVNMFAYSIGTNWAKILASNIYQASITNINVTASLEDILIQVGKARKLWEDKKKNTSEPRRLLASIPFFYILFCYVSIYQLNISIKEYIYNQFCSEQGMSAFNLIIIGYCVSYTLVKLMFSKKLDF